MKCMYMHEWNKLENISSSHISLCNDDINLLNVDGKFYLFSSRFADMIDEYFSKVVTDNFFCCCVENFKIIEKCIRVERSISKDKHAREKFLILWELLKLFIKQTHHAIYHALNQEVLLFLLFIFPNLNMRQNVDIVVCIEEMRYGSFSVFKSHLHEFPSSLFLFHFHCWIEDERNVIYLRIIIIRIIIMKISSFFCWIEHFSHPRSESGR